MSDGKPEAAWRRLAAALSAAGFLLGGCAMVPRRAEAPGPQPLPPEVAAYYSYPESPRPATVELVRDQGRFREFLVRFPFISPDFEPTEPLVELEWFASATPGRRPAILFNPILGGDYPLERGICRFLARQGFHVALVHRKTLKISPEHPVSHIELLLRQSVLRIRQAVDWMSAQEEVDPERLGSFGISMGGIASVMAAAVEPRLRCHVVALAGGGIPDILVTSRDSLLTKPRNRYLARQQMDLATLEAALREAIRTDPIRLAPYVDGQNLLLFVALADRTIGRANAFRLRDALHRPDTIFLPFGHYTSYLALPYVKYASLRFFKKRLGDAPDSWVIRR